MNEPKSNEPVPLAWVKLFLLPNDEFKNNVFGDEDQLKEMFAASFEEFPFLEEVCLGGMELARSKKNHKKN